MPRMSSLHLRVIEGRAVAGRPEGWGSLIDYREYLTARGLARKTIRAYESRVNAALRWAELVGADLCDLTASEAVALSEIVPKTHASRRQLRSALTHYWKFQGVAGHYEAIRVPTRPRPRWKGLEEPQVAQLLAVARGDWPRGGVVQLGLYLGLRREEMATLRWRDFDTDLEWVTIMGKGDRTRHLPVHPRIREMLVGVRWPGEWVFPGRFGGHISLTTVNNWIEEMGHRAGIGHLHPHQLRHTAGAQINDTTRDIHAAQEWLGHARVETTQAYTRVTRDRLVASMHAMDVWESGPSIEAA